MYIAGRYVGTRYEQWRRNFTQAQAWYAGFGSTQPTVHANTGCGRVPCVASPSEICGEPHAQRGKLPPSSECPPQPRPPLSNPCSCRRPGQSSPQRSYHVSVPAWRGCERSRYPSLLRHQGQVFEMSCPSPRKFRFPISRPVDCYWPVSYHHPQNRVSLWIHPNTSVVPMSILSFIPATGGAMVAKVSLQNLGTIVREKRGDRALRAVAADIGTSAPTLSRIEAGKMPDLQTFGKLCRWLEIDPASLLGGVARAQRARKRVSQSHISRPSEKLPPKLQLHSPTRSFEQSRCSGKIGSSRWKEASSLAVRRCRGLSGSRSASNLPIRFPPISWPHILKS